MPHYTKILQLKIFYRNHTEYNFSLSYNPAHDSRQREIKQENSSNTERVREFESFVTTDLVQESGVLEVGTVVSLSWSVHGQVKIFQTKLENGALTDGSLTRC